MICDYHVHSAYSDDSSYPPEQVVEDAIRHGLDEICFTEHVDYGIKPDWDHPEDAPFIDGRAATNCAYPHYFADLERLRERHAGRIAIKRGLELGVQSITFEENEALLERWGAQMDFAICSIHQTDNLESWNGQWQEGKTQDEYNLGYYEELLKVVQGFKGYSVLGHLDLIRRYDPAGPYPFERTRDLVAAILEQVIADGRGIELNTSSFRYGIDGLMPSEDVWRLYRDLGGTILTVGSDSHAPEHLGAYVRLGQRRLAALGFEGYCTYERWEPTFHRFDFL